MTLDIDLGQVILTHNLDQIWVIIMNENPDPLKELGAMKQVAEALDGLDEDAIRRVLNWVSDHFSIKINKVGIDTSSVSDSTKEIEAENSPDEELFEDVSEFYAVAQPASDTDKALVVAYWMQFHEGAKSIETLSVNTRLKHMGHGISNVTRAFENLKKTKPQLIVQLRKSGTSKQARKTFKVTTEGKKYVEQLLRNGNM